jgi:molybdate transport system substrate-binding protein
MTRSGGHAAGRFPALAAVALLVSGCGALESGGSSGGEDTTVTVLAAASLTSPFTTIAEQYMATHPGTDLRLSFGSSTTLAQQVVQGAPADLLATAGTSPLDLLGDIEPTETVAIARNTLEIATPPDNPAAVEGLADLAGPDVDVVLCASTVPCGRAADEVLSRAAVEPHVVSREIDVTATLAKVRLGEADAAVVYHSDVASAKGAVDGVEIPEADNAVLTYPLARLGDTAAAADFAAYVSGPEGTRVLTDAGFLAP